MNSWQTHYTSKLQSAEEALCAVQSGMRVYIQPGCAEPEALVEALLKYAPFVHDVEVVHLLTLGCAHYIVTEYGVAYLHGKTIRERSKSLIDISHPKFRDELYEYCERTKSLHQPQLQSAVEAR